jgi:hypothetical protein
MPYKVFKTGSEYCVHKNVDGKKGKKMGCHSSAAKARKQQQALYAAEGKKEIPMEDQEIIEETEVSEDEVTEKDRLEKGYVPWGVTSFKELEEAREAAESAAKTYDLLTDYTGLVSNVLESSQVEDKAATIAGLTKELESKLRSGEREKEIETEEIPQWKKASNSVIDWMKDNFDFLNKKDDEEDEYSFMTWKQADGRMRWFATYSNKFRDEDRPVPEIISEKSHIRFEELLDTKQVDMPELWLWHTPEWKFGVADWNAWDDQGFAVASGLIDEGKEAVAEWVGKQSDVAVSHGMPIDSIMRDPDDPTIIVGHITKEISPLPSWAAANKRTDFLILGNDDKNLEEDDMAISDNKKKKLQEDWNAPPSILETLEASNRDKAKKALQEDVEFKETEVEAEEAETEVENSETEQQAEQAEAEAQPEADQPEAQTEDADTEQSEFVTRDEVVEAITPMAKQLEALQKNQELLLDTVKELALSDEEKIEKAASKAPPASVAAMVAKQMRVVGSEEAEVDGRSALSKSKPAEAEAVGPTGIQFIDNMLTQEQ